LIDYTVMDWKFDDNRKLSSPDGNGLLVSLLLEKGTKGVVKAKKAVFGKGYWSET